jgi:hypothetical protein
MNQEANRTLQAFCSQPPASAGWRTAGVEEVSAMKGEFLVPAVRDVSLAVALCDFSAQWNGSHGEQSRHVRAGTISLCDFNQSKRFDIRSDANFGLVLLRNEAFAQVRQEIGQDLGAELRPSDTVEDGTMKQKLVRRLSRALAESANEVRCADSRLPRQLAARTIPPRYCFGTLPESNSSRGSGPGNMPPRSSRCGQFASR